MVSAPAVIGIAVVVCFIALNICALMFPAESSNTDERDVRDKLIEASRVTVIEELHERSANYEAKATKPADISPESIADEFPSKNPLASLTAPTTAAASLAKSATIIQRAAQASAQMTSQGAAQISPFIPGSIASLPRKVSMRFRSPLTSHIPDLYVPSSNLQPASTSAAPSESSKVLPGSQAEVPKHGNSSSSSFPRQRTSGRGSSTSGSPPLSPSPQDNMGSGRQDGYATHSTRFPPAGGAPEEDDHSPRLSELHKKASKKLHSMMDKVSEGLVHSTQRIDSIRHKLSARSASKDDILQVRGELLVC